MAILNLDQETERRRSIREMRKEFAREHEDLMLFAQAAKEEIKRDMIHGAMDDEVTRTVMQSKMLATSAVQITAGIALTLAAVAVSAVHASMISSAEGNYHDSVKNFRDEATAEFNKTLRECQEEANQALERYKQTEAVNSVALTRKLEEISDRSHAADVEWKNAVDENKKQNAAADAALRDAKKQMDAVLNNSNSTEAEKTAARENYKTAEQSHQQQIREAEQQLKTASDNYQSKKESLDALVVQTKEQASLRVQEASAVSRAASERLEKFEEARREKINEYAKELGATDSRKGSSFSSRGVEQFVQAFAVTHENAGRILTERYGSDKDKELLKKVQEDEKARHTAENNREGYVPSTTQAERDALSKKLQRNAGGYETGKDVDRTVDRLSKAVADISKDISTKTKELRDVKAQERKTTEAMQNQSKNISALNEKISNMQKELVNLKPDSVKPDGKRYTKEELGEKRKQLQASIQNARKEISSLEKKYENNRKTLEGLKKNSAKLQETLNKDKRDVTALQSHAAMLARNRSVIGQTVAGQRQVVKLTKEDKEQMKKNREAIMQAQKDGKISKRKAQIALRENKVSFVRKQNRLAKKEQRALKKMKAQSKRSAKMIKKSNKKIMSSTKKLSRMVSRYAHKGNKIQGELRSQIRALESFSRGYQRGLAVTKIVVKTLAGAPALKLAFKLFGKKDGQLTRFGRLFTKGQGILKKTGKILNAPVAILTAPGKLAAVPGKLAIKGVTGTVRAGVKTGAFAIRTTRKGISLGVRAAKRRFAKSKAGKKYSQTKFAQWRQKRKLKKTQKAIGKAKRKEAIRKLKEKTIGRLIAFFSAMVSTIITAVLWVLGLAAGLFSGFFILIFVIIAIFGLIQGILDAIYGFFEAQTASHDSYVKNEPHYIMAQAMQYRNSEIQILQMFSDMNQSDHSQALRAYKDPVFYSLYDDRFFLWKWFAGDEGITLTKTNQYGKQAAQEIFKKLGAEDTDPGACNYSVEYYWDASLQYYNASDLEKDANGNWIIDESKRSEYEISNAKDALALVDTLYTEDQDMQKIEVLSYLGTGDYQMADKNTNIVNENLFWATHDLVYLSGTKDEDIWFHTTSSRPIIEGNTSTYKISGYSKYADDGSVTNAPPTRDDTYDCDWNESIVKKYIERTETIGTYDEYDTTPKAEAAINSIVKYNGTQMKNMSAFAETLMKDFDNPVVASAIMGNMYAESAFYTNLMERQCMLTLGISTSYASAMDKAYTTLYDMANTRTGTVRILLKTNRLKKGDPVSKMQYIYNSYFPREVTDILIKNLNRGILTYETRPAAGTWNLEVKNAELQSNGYIEGYYYLTIDFINDGVGYGLGGFTASSYKRELLERTQGPKSVADPEVQCQLMVDHVKTSTISNWSKYSVIEDEAHRGLSLEKYFEKYVNAEDIDTATSYVMQFYEKPALNTTYTHHRNYKEKSQAERDPYARAIFNYFFAENEDYKHETVEEVEKTAVVYVCKGHTSLDAAMVVSTLSTENHEPFFQAAAAVKGLEEDTEADSIGWIYTSDEENGVSGWGKVTYKRYMPSEDWAEDSELRGIAVAKSESEYPYQDANGVFESRGSLAEAEIKNKVSGETYQGYSLLGEEKYLSFNIRFDGIPYRVLSMMSGEQKDIKCYNIQESADGTPIPVSPENYTLLSIRVKSDGSVIVTNTAPKESEDN